MQSRADITITVGFISLIFHVTYYFVFMLEILQHKNTERQYLVIILLYRARASEPHFDSRDQPIFLVRLVYIWKYTVTLATKFYLVRYTSHILIKASPWGVALT